MKTYTFHYWETERISWNETRRVRDEFVTGTIPELRERFGLKEYESISWARNDDPDRNPTRICTPRRLERFFNRKNLGKYLYFVK